MRPGARLSLRQRFLAVAALATLPGTLALLFLIGSFHADREAAMRSEALQMGEIASLEMERIIGGTKSVLLTMMAAPELSRPDAPDCDAFMSRVSLSLPQLRGFALTGPDGGVRCASGGAPSGIAFSPPAVGKGVLETGLYTRMEGAASALLPLTLGLGEQGALTTWLDLGWLQDRVNDRNLTPGGALTIADRDGVIVAREPFPERFVGTRIPDDFQFLVKASEPGTLDVVSQDGTERVIGYHPPAASGTGLYLGVGLSTETAMAQVWRSTWFSLCLALAGLLATFLMTWTVGDRIVTRPIRRLLETVGAWRAGDLDARTGMEPADGEIAELAGAIDGYMDEVSRDRAARARAERHREVLLAEMQHRIKNTLGTVQAIARQTFVGHAEPETVQVFSERLRAMAEAHAVLLTDHWESADLRQTLETTIGPFERSGGHRVRFDGPPLRIRSRGALALAMAVHELCTNATKYGALSEPDGGVDISWGVEGPPDRPRFRLTWTERGGPRTTPPKQTGFGSRMIETVLAAELDARAELDYRPEGLVFTLEGDAAQVLAEPDAES